MPAAGGFWQVVWPRAWPACSASRATPLLPTPFIQLPPQPGPATVTHTVTVPPGAAPASQATGQLAVAPAAPATQALAAPGLVPATVAAAAVPETLVPAPSVTLGRLLQGEGGQTRAAGARDFKALNIVLPVPARLVAGAGPNVPDAFAVIADRVGGDGMYTSNARSWSTSWSAETSIPRTPSPTASSTASSWPRGGPPTPRWPTSAGMPSSMIEGTYRENNMSLNTSRRHVIATAGPDKYLVSLSVTTTVGQAVAAATATDAITNGFKVSAVGTPASPG